MRLTVVGCSGSLPGSTSAASCYLLEADDAAGRTWRVLLDLGSGALGPLQRLVDLADVDAVWLSHLHPDHCLDLCGMYVAMRYDPRGGREGRLAVRGPGGTAERLARAYDAGDTADLSAAFAVTPWVEGETEALGPLRVAAFRVRHPVEAYGLRVSGPSSMRPGDDAVLAYTGDTDTCDALAPLARGADLLLAEAAFHEGRDDDVRGIHLTGRRAGQVAVDGSVGRLVLTHLPPWNDPRRTTAEAREVWGGPLDLAEPGVTYVL